ncbi:MAG: murein L,D-transpeptidase family protein [Dokdonella sp.]
MKKMSKVLARLSFALMVASILVEPARAADMRLAAVGDRADVATKRVRPPLERDLATVGLRFGDPIFLRIFKHEHELELWVRKREAYVLFRNYPICTWSGALGPKLRQGDGQSPEGFYSVGRGQLNPTSQFHLAFNLGYPNAYDRAHGRSGNFLMVHGNCVSIGCYAMGDAQIDEIYTLLEAALRGGQSRVDVHVFPFRFDHPPNADWRKQPWGDFWSNLEQGYRAFERAHQPPVVDVVGERYRVREAAASK